MGYNTDFSGELEFTTPLTADALAHLKTILGEDIRDHQDWIDEYFSHTPNHQVPTWIDLEVTEDSDGIKWNDSEKTYDLCKKINLVIKLMRKKFPGFGLKGSLWAHGEESDDNWKLIINKDGWASSVDLVLVTKDITCPNCKHTFSAPEEM